jgi:hypothetical protein
MPRKKRQIRADLARAGFVSRGGKGDHTVWVHPLVPGHVSVDGKDGDDAKRYDEVNLHKALDTLAKAKYEQQTRQNGRP